MTSFSSNAFSVAAFSNSAFDLDGAGPTLYTVPNVIGLDIYAATTAIYAVALTVGTVMYAFSNSIAAGRVISVSPVTGTVESPGFAVSLIVSLGVQPVVATTTVPNVVGLDEWVARSRINAAQLIIAPVLYSYSLAVPSSIVISQAVAAGSTVAVWTPVQLTVSDGYP